MLQAACPSVSAVPRPTTSATCASRPAANLSPASTSSAALTSRRTKPMHITRTSTSTGASSAHEVRGREGLGGG